MGDADTGDRGLKAEDLMQHSDALYRYALSRLGDAHTAEDLVQDALLTAVSKTADFEGRSTLRTWLIGILKHKLLDHFRRKGRHPQDQPDHGDRTDGEDQFTSLGAWRSDPNHGLDWLDADPDRVLARSELRAALRLCIDHLPRSLHDIFVMRELEALEPAEVCQTAGIAKNSLAVFLYRARQALRSCLQDQEVAP
jgi:RNA polymerase sigma-70 factor, ECF subfamily